MIFELVFTINARKLPQPNHVVRSPCYALLSISLAFKHGAVIVCPAKLIPLRKIEKFLQEVNMNGLKNMDV